MAVDIKKYAPPSDAPYRVIDYVQDKFLGLWDMNVRQMIATYEYWDADSQKVGSDNVELIAQTMNRAAGHGQTPAETLGQARLRLQSLTFDGLNLSAGLDRAIHEIDRLYFAVTGNWHADYRPEKAPPPHLPGKG